MLAIIALIVVLAVTNIALAVLYMTKNVTISGGVSVIGAIEVYDEDGTTPLTDYDFPLFTGGIGGEVTKHFFINNTGNQPVYLYWNISSSSIDWLPQETGFYHEENQLTKYEFGIFEEIQGLYVMWTPSNDMGIPYESLYIGVNERKELQIRLVYSGAVNTAETFTLVMSFYTQDA